MFRFKILFGHQEARGISDWEEGADIAVLSSGLDTGPG